MDNELRVVYQSHLRGECADRALVLAALNIPFQIVEDFDSCALLVPAEFSARAVTELQAYDQENPPAVQRPVTPLPTRNAIPGLLGYVATIIAVTWLAETAFLNKDWYALGSVDGVLIRAGEWWRTITALTLHADLQHLMGNLAFGIMFGFFAGRLLGSGVTWAGVVVAAAAGNTLNTFLLESTHRAIGASTAVFAALGLIAGFVWRGKLMRQDRWAYRLGPIVGGFALLMFTGTGGERTDIGAHLMGFLCGLGLGMALISVRGALSNQRLQIASGVAAFAMICGAWWVAIM